MRKEMIFLTITFIALLFLVSGCSKSQQSKGPATGTSSGAFIGGTDGVTLAFMDGSPPPEVYDNKLYPFSVSLKVSNQGEWDVPAGKAKIVIRGIDAADFGNPKVEETLNYEIYGKRKDAQGTITPGTITNVDFPGFSYSKKLTGSAVFNIQANICYPYGGKASTKMCIWKEMPRPKRTGDVCDVTRRMNPENSGSPVHISDFSQYPVGPHKISFSFKITHVGTGQLFSPENANCQEGDFSTKDKVKVTVDTGIAGLTCPTLGSSSGSSVSGEVKLFKDGNTITCTQDVGNVASDFEKAISIITEFNYKKSAQKSLIVKHIEQGGN